MNKHPYVDLGVTLSVIAALLVVAGTAALIVPDIKRHFRNQRILKDGVAATAVIKSVRETGIRYDGKPQIKLTVDVTPEKGEPYSAQLTAVVPVVDLPRYRKGAVVNVKYDPRRPTQVVLIKR